jgi:hypothetical protein
LGTAAAVAIVAAALALFVGVFLFFSNLYGGAGETQVTENITGLAERVNELPVAPLTPPAPPAITPPADTPPVTQ